MTRGFTLQRNIVMSEELSRTKLLLGSQALDKLQGSRVCVFGVGGVGGYVVEALVRSGIGAIDIVDNDSVSLSNINRQIIALHSTVGQDKVDVFRDRIKDINPEIRVTCHKCFYLPETSDRFDFTEYSYVVDAIDTVTAKIDIIRKCTELGVPVISSMGTGNKLDPTRITVTDIYKTQTDPLAKVMRRELKKRGIKKLKVVYSPEEPVRLFEVAELIKEVKRPAPGSVSFVPPAAGLIIAGEVIKDIISGI